MTNSAAQIPGTLSAAGVDPAIGLYTASVMAISIAFLGGRPGMILAAAATDQLPDLIGVPWLVYPLTALGLAVIFLFPRLTTAVPAPLVAIIVVTLVAVVVNADIPTVGDKGELPSSLPAFLIPDVPFTWETLQVIFPYALATALVRLLESMMTAKLVDDVTDTRSDKTRESLGQGGANVLAGCPAGWTAAR